MTTTIAVSGAGPAGAALALLLARAGVPVALLDRDRFPREKPCGESFGPGVRAFFARHRLDLPRACTPIRGIRLHAGLADLCIPYRTGDVAETGFGACRRDLDLVLVEAAVQAGATLLDEATVLAVSPSSSGLRTLSIRRHGRNLSLSAALVAGASGLGCPVARALGGRRHARGRIALLAHVAGMSGLTGFGEAHLVGRGFVGVAPVGDEIANVTAVYDRDDFRAELPRIGLEALWRASIDAAGLDPRLERAERIGPLRSTGPLGFTAGAIVSDQALLVGDAAGFVDPFTGDGVAVALAGAELAAPVAIAALGGREGASALALSAYARAHRRAIGPRLLLDRLLREATRHPRLATRLVAAIAAEPALAERLLAVPADLAPPSSLLTLDLLLPLVRATLN